MQRIRFFTLDLTDFQAGAAKDADETASDSVGPRNQHQ